MTAACWLLQMLCDLESVRLVDTGCAADDSPLCICSWLNPCPLIGKSTCIDSTALNHTMVLLQNDINGSIKWHKMCGSVAALVMVLQRAARTSLMSRTYKSAEQLFVYRQEGPR